MIAGIFSKSSNKDNDRLEKEVEQVVDWFNQIIVEREAQKQQLRNTTAMLRRKAETLENLVKDI